MSDLITAVNKTENSGLLLCTLLASALLHALLLGYFNSELARFFKGPPLMPALRQLQLTVSTQPPPVPEQHTPTPAAMATNIPPKPVEPKTPSRKKDAVPSPTAPEEIITPPTQWDFSHHQADALRDEASETSGNRTDNGSIVMNRQLLTKLNQSPRRYGLPEGVTSGVPDATYSAGSWNEFVQIGNRCFRVQLANPLDPISHEMWYPVSCGS